jgi:hypothetical protein
LAEQLGTRERRRPAPREARERLARERDEAPETPLDDEQLATIELILRMSVAGFGRWKMARNRTAHARAVGFRTG